MRLRNKLLPLLLMSLVTAAFARVGEIEKVKSIFITPVGTDPAAIQFQTQLKSELVHQGFAILPQADKADAILDIELVISGEGKDTKIESYSALKGEDENVLWSLSSQKAGPDKDKLIMNEARKVASNLKSKKTEVVIKQQEENEKSQKKR
jgi:hypothetical protein